jgi:hypothetical protein
MTDFEKEVWKRLIDREIPMKKFMEIMGISAPYLRDIFIGSRAGNAVKQKIVDYLELN